MGRHHKVAVLRGPGVAGNHVEQGRGVGAVLAVAGEQAQVRVDFGGGVVVVACAQVQVPADAVVLLAHHQGNLAVGL